MRITGLTLPRPTLHLLLLACVLACAARVMDAAGFSPPALPTPLQVAPVPADETEPIVRSTTMEPHWCCYDGCCFGSFAGCPPHG